ncbi:Pyridine nucleotide-disulfide oxidoreductase domain-containing protein 1 [Portunus trituberculatus]|uniref:Pyridine nucleotide-disulfide oxidoreductase domain-containing protein 1 n=1 Tax=Portunus trituberculatus TaxID=210409 RepID=A0A5B7E228_PORTR|nr:Pyridine nucleotide-disulfide oxidoreductase domain-containing protein 1 [Portunus trituberculatus]
MHLLSTTQMCPHDVQPTVHIHFEFWNSRNEVHAAATPSVLHVLSWGQPSRGSAPPQLAASPVSYNPTVTISLPPPLPCRESARLRDSRGALAASAREAFRATANSRARFLLHRAYSTLVEATGCCLSPLGQLRVVLVHTSTGRCFSYQKLCVCTGATPKLLAERGPHVVWLRDTESAQQFQAQIKDARRIMIVGNGGIATEMVYEVTGVEVIWAMKDKHMTAHFIDPGAAEFMQPELLKEKDEGPTVSKRRKYTVEHSSQVQKFLFLF